MILLSSVLIYKHMIALCIHCNVRDFTWPYHVLLWLLYLTPDCLMCIADLIVLPTVLMICIRGYALPLPIYLQLICHPELRNSQLLSFSAAEYLCMIVYAYSWWYIDSIILIITDCTLWYSFDDSILIITDW